MGSPMIKTGLLAGTGADIDVPLGFRPDVIEVVNLTDFSRCVWYRALLDENAIAYTASGTASLAVSTGINLIRIEGVIGSGNETVTVVEANAVCGLHANGFRLESDAGPNDNAELLHYTAIRGSGSWIRGVHDGTTSSNYFEDRSLDFRELGVTKGWVMYNFSNDNRCLVEEVQRPSGQTKYCRLTVPSSVAAADFDTADIVFVMPPDEEQITAITAMT